MTIRVAEMFAGVGGFRLALDGYRDEHESRFTMPAAGPYKTVWANQWEPPGNDSKQFAWRCYEQRFGEGSCVCEDIERVLDEYEDGAREIPDFDVLVGGFPCQDYSVGKPAPMAKGIEGKKGVLWWSIQRIMSLKRPRFALLENVDRLLKSPASQKGRDFSIMLSCLDNLGYSVEWMVVNAADYGMPQRRKRVYILATRNDVCGAHVTITNAFHVSVKGPMSEFDIPQNPYEASANFGDSAKSPFCNYGRMWNGHVITFDFDPIYDGVYETIGDVLIDDSEVPDEFFVNPDSLGRWEYLKGAKHEPRTAKSGYKYVYSEGAVAFPDPTDKQSRTILTSEGGSSPSRMRHVVRGDSGRLRRLVPEELERLQGFPSGWTNTGMSDKSRAFCMGNALVVGIPHAIGVEIAKWFNNYGD